MTQYFWKFNGPQTEIKLKKITAKSYVFEYPAGSVNAGQDWRMSKATVEHYIKIGAITIS